MRTHTISNEALAVLSGLAVIPDQQGNRCGTKVQIREQIERPLYVEVNKVLVDIGGKWISRVKSHVFDDPSEVVIEKLDAVVVNGFITPPSKNGYFPTPAKIADHVMEMADLHYGQSILEPSCGTGALIEAVIRDLKTQNPPVGIRTWIYGIENNSRFVSDLQSKFRVLPVTIKEADFMAYAFHDDLRFGSIPALYDRIVMNPPFELSADVKHVLRAWDLLKPGGRLVAIMSSGITFRRDRVYQQLNELIAEHGGIHHLPTGSFKESGTMVNTVIVVLAKPAIQ